MSEPDELLTRMVQYVESTFENGDRLPSERDLAEQFGVGRNLVRETLSKLEAYHLISMRTKARAVVTKKEAVSLERLALLTEAGVAIDLKKADQAVEVRRIIEISAIQSACERVTQQNLDRLAMILTASEAKIAAKEPINVEDELFHLEIIRSTQNEILVQLASLFYAITRQRRRRYFSSPERCKASHAEHLKLYGALEQRNARRAIKVMGSHLQDTATYWAELAAAAPEAQLDGS